MGSKVHQTCLEEQMHGYLTALGVVFSEQQPTRGGFILDFLIEAKKKDGSTLKIDLETDGTNWHSSKAQRNKDRFRDATMRSSGYVVVRVREGFTQHFVEQALHEVARRYACAIPGLSGD